MKSEPRRLYETVAATISAGILDGAYPVGSRLPAERELAVTFGVSRPTIREAIIALELDGLVAVRMGSGVYVTAREPLGGKAGVTDIGPFELLEARRLMEGEVCALAAGRMDDTIIATLRTLVAEMGGENTCDVVGREDADRRFHITIAQATQNSAMVQIVSQLWEARARSPQYQLLSRKVRAAGVIPRIEEHVAIVDALEKRDAVAARDAMRSHLARVIESLLEATESEEIEQARARAAAQRARLSMPQ